MRAGCIAVIIDLYSRLVVGWSMPEHMTAQLACDALKMAMCQRHMPTDVIIHSDCGSQYCKSKKAIENNHLTPESRFFIHEAVSVSGFLMAHLTVPPIRCETLTNIAAMLFFINRSQENRSK